MTGQARSAQLTGALPSPGLRPGPASTLSVPLRSADRPKDRRSFDFVGALDRREALDEGFALVLCRPRAEARAKPAPLPAVHRSCEAPTVPGDRTSVKQ